MEASDYYTTRQAAAKLHMKPATVALRASQGRYPGAAKVGRQWLIPKTVVDEMLRPWTPQPRQR